MRVFCRLVHGADLRRFAFCVKALVLLVACIPPGAGDKCELDCKEDEKRCQIPGTDQDQCVGKDDPDYGCGPEETCAACTAEQAFMSCALDSGVYACAIGGCTTGFMDCDSEIGGCETDYLGDADHCGGCKNASCPPDDPPHGKRGCVGGICTPTCDVPYGDCNKIYDDGCEVDTSQDDGNCDKCGFQCGDGEKCVNGGCTSVT